MKNEQLKTQRSTNTQAPRKLKLAVISSALIGSSFFVNNGAHADATIEMISDDQAATILVKDSKVLLKLNSAQNQQQSEAIFDQRTQTMHIIDHSNQTIFPLNQKSIKELSGTINAAVGVMQQQMENMSPEQRSQMEKMMGSLGISVPEEETTPEVTLSRVREYSYSNIKCDESKVMEGNQELATVCVSQGNSTQLSDQDYQSLLDSQNFMFSIASETKQFAKQYGQPMPNFGDLKLDGLLVNSVQKEAYGDSATNVSFRIKSIDVGNIEDIVIPAGYTERSLF